MSGQHTPGRLVHRVDAGGDMSLLVTASDDRGIVAAYVDEPDASRLAACWNACESMTTEQIEAHGGLIAGLTVGVAADAAERIVADRAELARLRTELTAANTRIAHVTAVAQSQDTMLSRRPCQNKRCARMADALALLTDVLKEAEGWHDECYGTPLVSDVAERAHTFLKGGA